MSWRCIDFYYLAREDLDEEELKAGECELIETMARMLGCECEPADPDPNCDVRWLGVSGPAGQDNAVAQLSAHEVEAPWAP